MRKVNRVPLIIKQGSVRVKIYTLAHRGARDGFVHQVAWYVGSLRKLKQFTSIDAAKKFAKERAAILASGDHAPIDIRRAELEELEAAKKLAGGTPLLSVVEEWNRAREICDGELLAAARYWKSRHGSSVKKIGASAAVDKFTAAKERQGVDVRCSYNKVLPHFSKRFADTRLDTISTTMLSEWLDRDFAHPLTRNTVRKRVVTLFRWARKQGYLPKDSRTEIEDTESARTAPMKIGIITADQLGVAFEKIREKAPRYVPALILAAHCGLRRSEVHGQSWADIRLDNKILRVTSAKRNTPAKRLVPISDSAVRSLREFESKGALCSNLAIDRIRDICITGGLDLPPNCFRHSFITYRCALTGDIPRTSMEAGNSSRVIHQYYRELATEEEGREYFETFTPETA